MFVGMCRLVRRLVCVCVCMYVCMHHYLSVALFQQEVIPHAVELLCGRRLVTVRQLGQHLQREGETIRESKGRYQCLYVYALLEQQTDRTGRYGRREGRETDTNAPFARNLEWSEAVFPTGSAGTAERCPGAWKNPRFGGISEHVRTGDIY